MASIRGFEIEVVAGEDGVEELRRVGGLAHRHQVLGVAGADDDAPVGDAQAEAHPHRPRRGAASRADPSGRQA